jgi:hypothetical protein
MFTNVTTTYYGQNVNENRWRWAGHVAHMRRDKRVRNLNCKNWEQATWRPRQRKRIILKWAYGIRCDGSD